VCTDDAECHMLWTRLFAQQDGRHGRIGKDVQRPAAQEREDATELA